MTDHTLHLATTSSALPALSTTQRIFDTLLAWIDRARERRQLAAMSDVQLKDVGLNRVDIHAETGKPFWRN